MEQNLTIETKSNPNDLVTNVDKATEDFIFDTILETYPNHQVLGEEGRWAMTSILPKVRYGLLTQ